MLRETSGGLDPSDVTEDAVNPMGSPKLVRLVTIAMPLAWFRNTALSASSPRRSKSLWSVVILPIRLGHLSKLHRELGYARDPLESTNYSAVGRAAAS